MAYSDNLRIDLIATGTQAGVWGTTTNTNLGTIIEDAIAGYAAVSVTSANQAFTIVDGAADQARNAMIRLTTTTAANFAVYAPPVSKQYVIQNGSAYTATIYNSTVSGNTTAAGAGVAIPAGKTMTVWSNATDFLVQNSHVIGTVVGNVTGDLTGNVTGNVAGTLTGVIASTTTATTQAALTNNTTVATTAFVTTADNLKADKTTTISAGTGLSGGGDLSTNRTLSIANTGVTAASYGGANAIPVLAINAQGQVTSASTAESYPTSYSLASATGASVSRTVYLTAGTWQVVLDTRAGISDSGNYSFNTTQSGSVGATTVNTSIGFSRTGGAGYGRTIHGSQLAVGTLTVATSGSYTLAMAAVSLNGAFSEGSRIIIEKTA
jgi:hypothetical protein